MKKNTRRELRMLRRGPRGMVLVNTLSLPLPTHPGSRAKTGSGAIEPLVWLFGGFKFAWQAE